MSLGGEGTAHGEVSGTFTGKYSSNDRGAPSVRKVAVSQVAVSQVAVSQVAVSQVTSPRSLCLKGSKMSHQRDLA
jgi:hypothetical protein